MKEIGVFETYKALEQLPQLLETNTTEWDRSQKIDLNRKLFPLQRQIETASSTTSHTIKALSGWIKMYQTKIADREKKLGRETKDPSEIAIKSRFPELKDRIKILQNFHKRLETANKNIEEKKRELTA